MIQLPEYKAVLDRTYHLVKPGGWLVIEDVDNRIYDDVELGNALLTAYTAWSDVLKTRGVNSRSSIEYESLLKESGIFSEIKVHKVAAPVSGQTDSEYKSSLFLFVSLAIYISTPLQTQH